MKLLRVTRQVQTSGPWLDGMISACATPGEHASIGERKRGTHFSLAADPSQSVRKASRPMESELSLACTRAARKKCAGTVARASP